MRIYLKVMILIAIIGIACAEDHKRVKRYYNPWNNIFNRNSASNKGAVIIPKNTLRTFVAPMLRVLLRMTGATPIFKLPPAARILLPIGLSLGSCILSPICKVALTDPSRWSDFKSLMQAFGNPQAPNELVAQKASQLIQKYSTPENLQKLARFGLSTAFQIVG